MEERDREVEEAKPKTTRRIILIRHGQYESDPDAPEDKGLTPLGRQQAVMTGKRLKELLKQLEGSLVDGKGEKKAVEFNLIRSTMPRASETASLIMDELGRDDIKVTDCDLIREGAPIPPEPPVPKAVWDPEPNVSIPMVSVQFSISH